MEEKRDFKVTNSWGIYDAYKYIRKKGWYDISRPLKEHEFYSIIRSMNKLLADNISLGETVKLPYKMGSIELRKYEVGVNIDSLGVLHNTYPIDWFKTLQLWDEDPDAYTQRLLIRNENPWLFHIFYNKRHAVYENKIFYQFYPNTFIKRNLSKNIKQGKVDTLYG